MQKVTSNSAEISYILNILRNLLHALPHLLPDQILVQNSYVVGSIRGFANQELIENDTSDTR